MSKITHFLAQVLRGGPGIGVGIVGVVIVGFVIVGVVVSYCCCCC